MRYQLLITGRVQGIGLRPEVYRLSLKNELTGFIKNLAGGVALEIQGEQDHLDHFIALLQAWYESQCPSNLAYRKEIIPDLIEKEFSILESEQRDNPFCGDIPPDRAVCPACRHDFFSPENKRHLHPLISCTDCGPRYSILKGFPLDRVNYSWEKFHLCASCRTEYVSAESRLFHAENISCPECAPRFMFINDAVQEPMGDPFRSAAEHIKSGNICAIKSTGGFHLVCSALSADAVAALRKLKNREKKPFAVMYPDIAGVKAAFPDLSGSEAGMLLSAASPIVIVKGQDRHLAGTVTEGIDFTGVFLPYNGIYLRLLDLLEFPLVVTSANNSDEPLAVNRYDLENYFYYNPPAVLDHEMEIIRPLDDSVVRLVNDSPLLLRSGRGFAPHTLNLDFPLRRKRICLGADLKNTFVLAVDKKAVISPYTGNINNGHAGKQLQGMIHQFSEIYKFTPEVAVCDMHPDYITSGIAADLDIPLLKVQHHHAHSMALMAEHGFQEHGELFCAVFDGTGYGTDGNIWGGEFLLSRFDGFKRISHLKYFRNPGMDTGVKEGYRSALSILFELYGEKALNMNLAVKPAGKSKIFLTLENFYKLWAASPNQLSSSAGRLFDAVASILGILHVSAYEGQAGLLLESIYDHTVTDSYPFPEAGGILDWSELFEAIRKERNHALAASRFINSLAGVIIRQAEPYGEFGISGGVFQNAALVFRIKKLAVNKKLRLYLHRTLPPNDSNISAGQAAYMPRF